jgi:G3E family GTPase
VLSEILTMNEYKNETNHLIHHDHHHHHHHHHHHQQQQQQQQQQIGPLAYLQGKNPCEFRTVYKSIAQTINIIAVDMKFHCLSLMPAPLPACYCTSTAVYV